MLQMQFIFLLIMVMVDFVVFGVSYGFLWLLWLCDDVVWGLIMMLIIVVVNGEGLIVLLIGVNYGDEYEGLIVLFDLVVIICVEDVIGCIIIVFVMNYLVFGVGICILFIDKGNLNCSFFG